MRNQSDVINNAISKHTTSKKNTQQSTQSTNFSKNMQQPNYGNSTKSLVRQESDDLYVNINKEISGYKNLSETRNFSLTNKKHKEDPRDKFQDYEAQKIMSVND